MLESIIHERLVLAVAVAVTAVVLVVVLVWVVKAARRRSRNRTAVIRHEPVFGEGYAGEPEAELQEDWSRGDGVGRRRRGRFGFGALALSFFVGSLAGIGGWMLASGDGLQPMVRTMVEVAEAGVARARAVAGLDLPDETPRDVRRPEDPDRSPRDSQVGESLEDKGSERPRAAEVEARLAIFAGNLKGTLPRDAGPEFLLTSVEMDGMAIRLGYTVARALSEDAIPAFDAYLMRTVESLFCGNQSREIRFLNDNGVAFYMAYRDARGETVANLTVPPSFCA